ncbi:alpha/beta fold hydrolase [Sutcliffiella rhizosphaerae]|uniref:Poly(3-hydroxyalkanoate) polymerase subunit PhaC n=1 Tax=Sutcliffiella rhizosphaerae TaxID=2880967 RepID=A0ABM8YM46_9BACI|nr:alpha/beta fold hydrolase [Sutcliffiella rhizosphaerae]CAG9620970.1 Poly(3-hydroxyalkanoate) polymerase subunit PhaC [Sutcliffiella rhizosphaerae]
MDNDMEKWKSEMSKYNDTPYKDGITPRVKIWTKNKATLWHYPAINKNNKTPIFIIYSLVNQPFILDLLPGASTIEAFVSNGYDVYLIDFGKPGLEDRNMTISDYVSDYIERAVQKTLAHAETDNLTVLGYCLGGTLAAIHASITSAPIKNLILFVTPIDFHTPPYFDKWVKALRKGNVQENKFVNEIGVLPASFVEAGIRLVTSPIYITPYLSLLTKKDDKNYVEKWLRFNAWTKGHIPMTSGVANQIGEDLIKDNKLMKGTFMVNGKQVKLENIKANLLVVGTEGDRLVPLHQIMPIMEKVSSIDKHIHILQGGHTGTSVENGKIPAYLDEWLSSRS